jgi:hypothetical protein
MISDDMNYDMFETLVEDIAFNGLSTTHKISNYMGVDFYKLIREQYNEGNSPFETVLVVMKELALGWWSYLACSDIATLDTDYAVNDLLEDVADTKYLTTDDDDNPIYNTIQSLDFDELRTFIKGCIEIEQKL